MGEGTLEVRIRLASNTTSSYLCDVQLAEVNDVIPTLRMWTIAGYDELEMSGQFVMEEPGRFSYFEVIVHDT